MAKNTPNSKPACGGLSKAEREAMIKAAQVAWAAIMSGSGDRWRHWEEVCPMLQVCRHDAMREVGLDRAGTRHQQKTVDTITQ
jgi:hypothetical protein